jgi:excinuclease UvrABC nuclease subunit
MVKSFKFEKNDPTLFFMQRLRDEAHRFAITLIELKEQKEFQNLIRSNRWYWSY